MADPNVGDFLKVMKTKFARCLEPTMSCTNQPIKAHSVQNSTALGFIVENGHVMELRTTIRKGELKVEFTDVGRNEASTFLGFCNQHDTQIFVPIDTKPLSFTDPEQLFLLAYRSVTRELHATMQGGLQAQTALVGAVKRGQVSENEVSPTMVAATMELMKSWVVYRYRAKFFDMALVRGRYTDIKHSVFIIKGEPKIACSAFFGVEFRRPGKLFPAVCLNIVPIGEDETAVIFSYASEDSGKVRRFIAPVMLQQDETAKLLQLSHLIVNNAENFFLRPSVVARWTEEKKSYLISAFLSTIDRKMDAAFDERQMLF